MASRQTRLEPPNDFHRHHVWLLASCWRRDVGVVLLASCCWRRVVGVVFVLLSGLVAWLTSASEFSGALYLWGTRPPNLII
jgi:hypothetical protein